MAAFVPPVALPHSPSPHRTITSSTRTCRRPTRMIAKPENEPNAKISSTVETLYDTYPFPPETILDSAPLGYNWRWHYPSAYAFCTDRHPPKTSVRILDAGCGTGESTSYLVHLNEEAEVVGMDLSAGALAVAEERLKRATPDEMNRVELVHKSVFDAMELEGEFDLINCVGVIHHTPDPDRALRALGGKLKEGGIMHVFVYGKNGRWEISLMQKAMRLLNGDGSFEDGVALGRRVFRALPDDNRLKKREETRWAAENVRDANFADMYLHPQEIDYDVDSLFRLVDQSGLQFVGFSNPRTWDPSRILGADEELLEKVKQMPLRDQWRLIELLDPESITHFEFFLAKPPYSRFTWTDTALETATATLSPCMTGFPSTTVLDRDYHPVMLTDPEHALMSALTSTSGLSTAIKTSNTSYSTARQLCTKGLILLAPLT